MTFVGCAAVELGCRAFISNFSISPGGGLTEMAVPGQLSREFQGWSWRHRGECPDLLRRGLSQRVRTSADSFSSGRRGGKSRGSLFLAEGCFGISGCLGRPKCPRCPLVLALAVRKSLEKLPSLYRISWLSVTCVDEAQDLVCESNPIVSQALRMLGGARSGHALAHSSWERCRAHSGGGAARYPPGYPLVIIHRGRHRQN